jgi:hypothetical protein
MQPIHSLEYELTSELATEVTRTLVRWQLRRGWRRDVSLLAGVMLFAVLIIWLSLRGWILPGVGGGLMAVLMLFALGAVLRRWAMARGAALTALLGLHTSDRRVRIEFSDERVRLETEFFRGEGAWTELDEVVIFPGYWLLQFSNGGHIMVPGQLVSSELQAFIRAKAQQAMAPMCQG